MAFSYERGERYSFGQTPYADKPDTGGVPVAKEFGALNNLSRHLAEDAYTLKTLMHCSLLHGRKCYDCLEDGLILSEVTDCLLPPEWLETGPPRDRLIG